MECPTCHFNNSGDLNFCVECGNKLQIICPICCFGNSPNYKFCGKCGHDLKHLPIAVESKLGRSLKDIIKSKTVEIEKQIIIKSLDDCGGNVSKAASLLGISRKGLQLKMIKYELRKDKG